MCVHIVDFIFFFFNDTATTEIYTLSLHDALPIYDDVGVGTQERPHHRREVQARLFVDRKSTRLNSSHTVISYAVFCLKKKKNTHYNSTTQPNTCSTYSAQSTNTYRTQTNCQQCHS